LALVIYELATNSLKYGALSSGTGTLDVTTAGTSDGRLELVWMERGGPDVKAPPEPNGFGSKLVHRSVSKQLGGAIEYDWASDGLIVTLRLDRTRLAS
ncbi:MAG TPA: sensor histidine kinase, partial [Allosphingosinicella sp.]|nr:sensor histidine kinase [Allosphingosinicella sp.]